MTYIIQQNAQNYKGWSEIFCQENSWLGVRLVP